VIGQHAPVEKLAAALIGAVVSLWAWMLLVPWDLSEVDADGLPRAQGGDDHGGVIALVAGLVVALAVGLLLAPRWRRAAVPVATGGLMTWTVLFTWRAGVSETSGANMFLVPVLFAVIPLTVAVPLVLRRWTDRLDGGA
jgi:uncharacterized membrane protein